MKDKKKTFIKNLDSEMKKTDRRYKFKIFYKSSCSRWG